MSKGLGQYKAFIDGLVKRKNCVESRWIMEKGYPQNDDNRAVNQLLSTLTAEQRAILAKMVQDAKLSGIHDTLAYVDEMMDCDGLVLSQDGEVYPHDYFESMHYDFICRSEGDAWPE